MFPKASLILHSRIIQRCLQKRINIYKNIRLLSSSSYNPDLDYDTQGGLGPSVDGIDNHKVVLFNDDGGMETVVVNTDKSNLPLNSSSDSTNFIYLSESEFLEKIPDNLKQHSEELLQYYQVTSDSIRTGNVHAGGRLTSAIKSLSQYGPSALQFFFGFFKEYCNVMHWSTYLHCLNKHKDSQLVIESFNEAIRLRIPLDNHFVSIIVNTYARIGQYDKVDNLLNQMALNNMIPSNTTIALLITNYARSRNSAMQLKALKLYSDFVIPNRNQFYTYNQSVFVEIMHIYSTLGQYGAAINLLSLLLREMNSKDISFLANTLMNQCKRSRCPTTAALLISFFSAISGVSPTVLLSKGVVETFANKNINIPSFQWLRMMRVPNTTPGRITPNSDIFELDEWIKLTNQIMKDPKNPETTINTIKKHHRPFIIQNLQNSQFDPKLERPLPLLTYKTNNDGDCVITATPVNANVDVAELMNIISDFETVSNSITSDEVQTNEVYKLLTKHFEPSFKHINTVYDRSFSSSTPLHFFGDSADLAIQAALATKNYPLAMYLYAREPINVSNGLLLQNILTSYHNQIKSMYGTPLKAKHINGLGYLSAFPRPFLFDTLPIGPSPLTYSGKTKQALKTGFSGPVDPLYTAFALGRPRFETTDRYRHIASIHLQTGKKILGTSYCLLLPNLLLNDFKPLVPTERDNYIKNTLEKYPIFSKEELQAVFDGKLTFNFGESLVLHTVSSLLSSRFKVLHQNSVLNEEFSYLDPNTLKIDPNRFLVTTPEESDCEATQSYSNIDNNPIRIKTSSCIKRIIDMTTSIVEMGSYEVLHFIHRLCISQGIDSAHFYAAKMQILVRDAYLANSVDTFDNKAENAKEYHNYDHMFSKYEEMLDFPALKTIQKLSPEKFAQLNEQLFKIYQDYRMKIYSSYGERLVLNAVIDSVSQYGDVQSVMFWIGLLEVNMDAHNIGSVPFTPTNIYNPDSMRGLIDKSINNNLDPIDIKYSFSFPSPSSIDTFSNQALDTTNSFTEVNDNITSLADVFVDSPLPTAQVLSTVRYFSVDSLHSYETGLLNYTKIFHSMLPHAAYSTQVQRLFVRILAIFEHLQNSTMDSKEKSTLLLSEDNVPDIMVEDVWADMIMYSIQLQRSLTEESTAEDKEKADSLLTWVKTHVDNLVYNWEHAGLNSEGQTSRWLSHFNYDFTKSSLNSNLIIFPCVPLTVAPSSRLMSAIFTLYETGYTSDIAISRSVQLLKIKKHIENVFSPTKRDMIASAEMLATSTDQKDLEAHQQFTKHVNLVKFVSEYILQQNNSASKNALDKFLNEPNSTDAINIIGPNHNSIEHYSGNQSGIVKSSDMYLTCYNTIFVRRILNNIMKHMESQTTSVFTDIGYLSQFADVYTKINTLEEFGNIKLSNLSLYNRVRSLLVKFDLGTYYNAAHNHLIVDNLISNYSESVPVVVTQGRKGTEDDRALISPNEYHSAFVPSKLLWTAQSSPDLTTPIFRNELEQEYLTQSVRMLRESMNKNRQVITIKRPGCDKPISYPRSSSHLPIHETTLSPDDMIVFESILQEYELVLESVKNNTQLDFVTVEKTEAMADNISFVILLGESGVPMDSANVSDIRNATRYLLQNDEKLKDVMFTSETIDEFHLNSMHPSANNYGWSQHKIEPSPLFEKMKNNNIPYTCITKGKISRIIAPLFDYKFLSNSKPAQKSKEIAQNRFKLQSQARGNFKQNQARQQNPLSNHKTHQKN